MQRLAPRIYLDVSANEMDIIRKNIFEIIGALYPGAVISHRSALETGLDVSKKHIVITHRNVGDRNLPGVVIHVLDGPGPQPEDLQFVSGLYISSISRSWLECFQSRKKGKNDYSKTFKKNELEERLDRWIALYGEEKFKKQINDAHILADRLGWQSEASRFQKVAGALLGTRSLKMLTTRIGKARGAGLAYDTTREEIFMPLIKELRLLGPGLPIDRDLSRDEWAIQCFFEAYFSNYIEGTIFTVEEAQAIVFDEKVPENRPEGHDIIATYKILFPLANNPKKIPQLTDYDSFETDLRQTHASLMATHPQNTPGEFKTKLNRVGDTIFVKPELVAGTLRRGFEYLGAFSEPIQRALFMKFLIAEVHPFPDGNGRLSRIMMNRELHAGHQWPIMIPTVYCIDYRSALRKLSLNKNSDAFLKVMIKAQCIAAFLDYHSLEQTRLELESYRAFKEDENITFDWQKLERKKGPLSKQT